MGRIRTGYGGMSWPIYPFFTLLITVALLFPPATLTAQHPLPDSITSLWITYKNDGNDSARIVHLARLAFFYLDYLEDYHLSDSLADAAVRIAELNQRPGLLMLAYNLYLESTDNATYYDKSLCYAGEALKYCLITHNLPFRWRTYINMTKVYLSKYDLDNAIHTSKEALRIAELMKNDTLVAENLLYYGISLGYKTRKKEAFTNFLSAKEIAERMGYPVLLQKCYARLFSFYFFNKLFFEAFDSKRKEETVISTIEPIDSVALMWVEYDLQAILVSQQDSVLSDERIMASINFAIRKRHERLKNWEFALFRRHLLERDDVKRLYNFYMKSYPDDFYKLYKTDLGMYFRLKAYFTEFEKKTDSANYYFTKAEQLLISASDQNNIFKSNFYTRFGQFLLRHGNEKEAIEKFTLSYNLAESDEYPGRFGFMLTPCRNLEALYRKAGDYNKAWHYAMANLQIYDSINKSTEYAQIFAERLRQERSQKELAAEIDRQKISQGKTQRNMFAGGVVFFIIVTLLVHRNFRNQKRLNRLLDVAKKRSDQLLLNILPVETAEELKLTGKASARRFDEVTVMFTDFKNFTQASESMSAEELVDVINFYYSEFDNIISRHNIEKIKIIGDSYMCAGGLPVPNETHALDVVNAAIELQEFMSHHRTTKIESGESFFELRIGIHTGPVVAGIVGHKKFAYDIWGDTVNTASRMENTGEPNKINISGETYKRVKANFNCTYRGKIPAKHKGQIDMYYVDSSVAPEFTLRNINEK